MKDGCHIADAASPAGRCIALGIAETSQQGARAPIDLLDQFGQKNVVFFSHPKELQPFAGENSASPTPCLTTSTQSHEYHGGSTTSDTHLEHKLFHVLGANLTHEPPRDKYIPTTHMPFPVFLCAFFKMLILQTKQSRC